MKIYDGQLLPHRIVKGMGNSIHSNCHVEYSASMVFNRLNAVSAYMRKMDHYGHSDFF